MDNILHWIVYLHRFVYFLIISYALIKSVSQGMLCDFEAHCEWNFESPGFPYSRDTKNNFRIIVGSRDSMPTHFAYFNSTNMRAEPAMIISPYYQYLSPQCELRISYRIFGESSASLVITSQHKESTETTQYIETYDYDDSDWTRPTLHATFYANPNYMEPWKTVEVHIGSALHPTRIRVECHPSSEINTKKNYMHTECYVDDIELIGCEEEVWYENVCHSNRTRKYLCHQYGHRKCVDYDKLCDMTIDCPGGEDEQNDLHSCTEVPAGARCTFDEEDNDPENICDGWRLETYYIHNSKFVDKGQHLLMRMNTIEAFNHALPKHLPLSDHTYLHFNNSGHFLFFTSDKEAVINKITDKRSSYLISPNFPPTDPMISDPSMTNNGKCKLRFYYCAYGNAISTLQLIIQPLNGKPSKVIWTPPSISLIDKHSRCEWSKISVDLPEQKSEYYLKFNVNKIFNTAVTFAIDDLSMTPNCFLGGKLWRSQYLPSAYNLSSCGRTGHRAPIQDECVHFYNNSAHDNIMLNITNGLQRWAAPKTLEYKIEAYGAAGGSLPRQTVNNFGGRVATVVNLTTAMELEILVGQKGESPCENIDILKNNINEHQSSALTYLCNMNKSHWSKETAIANAIIFPGTGGGGATVIKHLGEVILVAGGGGGLFAENLFNVEQISTSSKGGHALEESFGNIWGQDETADNAAWMSGRGASLMNNSSLTSCETCLIMAGELSNTSSAGGDCPIVSIWKMRGGFGGGGASCGPGGGGGAGYYGGSSGQKYHGGGGWSYSFQPYSFIEPGINQDDGYVLIYPCRLHCISNATCRFRLKNATDNVSYCLCPNGHQVYENEECPHNGSLSHDIFHPVDQKNTQIILLMTIAAVTVFATIIFLIFGMFCIYFQRRLKSVKLEKIELSREISMCTAPSNAPMNISGNPIYEPFGICAELRQIPRQNVTLIKLLGQGAFGEVYEGCLIHYGHIVQVAVKTLPKTASKQAINDFEMEALIMSKFRHENICELKGVCFDVTPRLILLELLAGGDLKSFLRECRPRNDNEHKINMMDLYKMCLDVAKGCKFLADNRFIHRDIAARNCLLTTKGQDRIVKIADFGMARDIYRQDYYRKGGKAMLPIKWMPPEAFLDGIFTVKTDVWSFGVLMWEIFSLGYMPYTGRNNQEVMSLVVKGGRLEPPTGVPDCLYKLMLVCWSTSDADRPKFDEIIERLNLMLMESSVETLSFLSNGHISPEVNAKSITNNASQFICDSQVGHSPQTANTSLNSNLDETTKIGDPLPTKGDGIQFNVCSPYKPQSSDLFTALSLDKMQTLNDNSFGEEQNDAPKPMESFIAESRNLDKLTQMRSTNLPNTESTNSQSPEIRLATTNKRSEGISTLSYRSLTAKLDDLSQSQIV